MNITAWKASKCGPYFPAFRLNAERYPVHFSRSVCNSGHFMILSPVLYAFFKFLGFFLRIESSYGFPSTTQNPSTTNYSICNYEPLPFSNMKRYCCIYLFSFLRIIYLLCSTECLIKDGIFTEWKYSSLT